MKKTALALLMLLNFSPLFAEEHHGHHMHEMSVPDSRISLNLSPAMKQHQLSNMREHVVAIREIVGLIADNKFDNAAQIAHEKLGLTPDMQQMCGSFGNDQFKTLGFAFHKSADDLADALKTKNTQTSLRALHQTLNYCVECHATFRQ